MTSPYEVEASEPVASRCACCGGLTVRLTSFVYRDGDAFAVYHAVYSNNHPDNEVGLLVSLGPWGEGSSPGERVAFYGRARPIDDSYGIMLADAESSPWSDAEILGVKLSRDAALGHPSKATALEVMDEAFFRDASLRGFLDRAHCGDTSVPNEHNFGLPDDVFALGGERERRAKTSRSFASMDDARFFVRCLLPIPVEGYDVWSVGLWIELSKDDYDRVRGAWDDADVYPSLGFDGLVANDGRTDLDLPIAHGASVRVQVRDPDAPPFVDASTNGELASLLENTWPKEAFEKYALARGYL